MTESFVFGFESESVAGFGVKFETESLNRFVSDNSRDLACTHFCMAPKDKAKQGLDITYTGSRC